MNTQGTLHFFCGKMASGKSTKAKALADAFDALLLSEDHWLKSLYPVEIKRFEDYINYSARLRALLKPHIQELLHTGVSVILDFPGNTKRHRAWFREIFSEHGFPHQLHYIVASDELCIKQLKQRSANLPEGSAFTTEEEFHTVNRYFQAPSEDEGFNVQQYTRE